ncbi:MAG TPA: hypothetical protein VFT08_03320 [Pyrinomonadaceae bacterium]|nr:hypothetical protein [Pyrinomonadaceae bacterium]
MLRKFCASLFALCLVFISTALPASAQVAGTVGGKFNFIMSDELAKYLEFEATSAERGGATGYMLFTDEAKVVVVDPDGEGDPKEEPVPFFMKAEWDAMTIEKNRALMSGVIKDSSVRSYIGKWVQLVIEDNDGREQPDKFVWSFCEPEPGGWIPSDFEVPGDQGAFLSWWSTDAERKDDVGMPSPSVIPGQLKACKAYSLQSYEFAEILKGDGVITIKQ